MNAYGAVRAFVTDVHVTTPYGTIPWSEVSRFNDHEIKRS